MDDIDGGVDIEKWWRYVDGKIVEAAVFRSSPSESIQVTDIAPWIPPSCRNSTILNTEHLKVSSALEPPNTKPFGCPKKLADLVRRGRYNPLELHGMTIPEVKQIAAEVEIPSSVASTKVYSTEDINSIQRNNRSYFLCGPHNTSHALTKIILTCIV